MVGTSSGTAPPLVVFVTIVVAAIVAIGTASALSSPSSSENITRADCNQPSYITKVASQVEENPKFTSQTHGLSYFLASGNDDGATTGTVKGKPFYAPPKTNLVFYSFGTDSQSARCPMTWDLKGVVGALWVKVPKNPDGSYKLSSMSVYFTPGVFINSTITKN